jgi:uncharacterized protein with HEPN domain
MRGSRSELTGIASLYSDDQRLRFEHIVENVDNIASYVEGLSYEEYAANPMIVDAVERCLARITEAAIKVGAEAMRRAAPDQPFEQIRGLGNILRHAYDVVDREIVWRTVKERLPTLRDACAKALG